MRGSRRRGRQRVQLGERLAPRLRAGDQHRQRPRDELGARDLLHTLLDQEQLALELLERGGRAAAALLALAPADKERAGGERREKGDYYCGEGAVSRRGLCSPRHAAELPSGDMQHLTVDVVGPWGAE